MEFSFGDEIKGGPLTLGLHKRGSFYDILTVDQCMIADRDFNLLLRAVLDYMTEARIPFYKKMEKTGILRHLLVRKTYFTQEILVDLVTASGYEPEDSFVQLLLDLPLSGKLAGILHTTNDSIADIVADQGTAVLYGQPFITEKLLGLEFKITPFSFFQTNSAGAETLYSIVRDFVGNTEGKVIYDLYSGTGTIAQILAPVAETGDRAWKSLGGAVEAARENEAAHGMLETAIHLRRCSESPGRSDSGTGYPDPGSAARRYPSERCRELIAYEAEGSCISAASRPA